MKKHTGDVLADLQYGDFLFAAVICLNIWIEKFS